MERAGCLIEGVIIEASEEHVRVSFPAPWQILSSAVLNGGLLQGRHVVNMKVCDHDATSSESCGRPEDTIASYCDGKWKGLTVGMMTAAPMDSMRAEAGCLEGEEVGVVVTAGLSNPRRAGDKADVEGLHREGVTPGTINIIAATTARLSRAAMVESVMVVSEAKAAVLQELGVTSPVSGLTATGTGTDAIALACPVEGLPVKYAGKHVAFGEVLAKLVQNALRDSISAP